MAIIDQLPIDLQLVETEQVDDLLDKLVDALEHYVNAQVVPFDVCLVVCVCFGPT